MAVQDSGTLEKIGVFEDGGISDVFYSVLQAFRAVVATWNDQALRVSELSNMPAVTTHPDL